MKIWLTISILPSTNTHLAPISNIIFFLNSRSPVLNLLLTINHTSNWTRSLWNTTFLDHPLALVGIWSSDMFFSSGSRRILLYTFHHCYIANMHPFQVKFINKEFNYPCLIFDIRDRVGEWTKYYALKFPYTSLHVAENVSVIWDWNAKNWSI